MPIDLTEELVVSMAPGDKAVVDGRGLIKKGAFRALARSEDGSLVFAECKGSGAQPYKVSMDLETGGERPTLRCSCPSHQHPCKHAIGLMLAFVAKGSEFKIGPAPADLLEKRTKLLEKRKNAPAAAPESAQKPKGPNKAAAAKKAEEQKAALDTLEKFVLDLVAAGLGGLNARRVKSVQEQARRMSDAGLNGAKSRLLHLASLVAGEASRDDDEDDDEDGDAPTRVPMSAEERATRVAALVTQLWVTIRKGRRALEGKIEEGETRSEADAEVESILGRAWRLPELKEAGYWTQNRTVVELAHERTEDDVLDESAAVGYLLDLDDGSIYAERTNLPRAAIRAGATLRPSRPGVITLAEAALYPGEVINRRFRWDEKANVATERPRAAEDYARVHAHAKGVDAAVKAFREQLKNPLAPPTAVVLLAAKRFGLAQDGALVMEDAAGQRLVFKDPRDTQYATTPNLQHAAGAFGAGSVAARLWYDVTERAIYAQPLALFAGADHLRLGM